MSQQTEQQLENELIARLVENGYELIRVPDVTSLQKNFRNEMNRMNAENLNGSNLSDKEFERLLLTIEGKSVFESAKILRDKHVLIRDDGSTIYIQLFNKQHWHENHFQVTNQTTVVGRYTNRYDVTLLVNGIPVVQVELKRRGLHYNESFNQILRYRKDSYGGLYNFLQLFVVTNGVDTKYFANSDREPMKSHMFFWSDVNNKRISDLQEFTDTFLKRKRVSEIIHRYMIINETDKHLMVMRPYQIFAVEAIMEQSVKNNENGYVWHTTGSGKTLTSFKASELLANEESVKKVIFLVDRRDLDAQTMKEFNKFEKDSVDETDKTDVLVSQLADPMRKRIITTIQKMSNAVKSKRYESILDQYKDEKVIFIIDECHRSQFGEMNRLIQRHFNKAQYFGFTGTPRLPENKSQDGRTTADLFNECLHTYLIKDAINDGNVLGFSVEYIETMKHKDGTDDNMKVPGIDRHELWNAEERISKISKHITEIHSHKTVNRNYTAIFTVESIPAAVRYYDALKKLDTKLKISAIYTYGANEESVDNQEHSRHALERIISDYNGLFDTNFSTETFANYFRHVSDMVKAGQIDILIVVNMFLTGFDSKKLNTLYVDRNLRHHQLIQAYSRTNRVEKPTKTYGNIVNYRNLKEQTDEAVKLFSKTGDIDIVLMKDYAHYVEEFKEQLNVLYSIVLEPKDVDELQGETAKKEFITAFRDLTRILTKLRTFVDFKFSVDEIGMDAFTFAGFRSKYLSEYDQVNKPHTTVSVLDDVDFEIELMRTDRINVDYILELLRNIDYENENERNYAVRTAIKEVNESGDEELRLKRELLLEFLQQVAPTLTNKDSVDDKFHDFENFKRQREIKEMSEKLQLAETRLEYFLKEYEFSGVSPDQAINDSIQAPFREKMQKVKKVKQFIYDNVRKYS